MRGGKSFLLLVVVALGLGAYVYFVEMKKDPSDTAAKTSKVFTLESEKIDSLTVKSASGDTTTLKKENGAWKITAPAGLATDIAEVSGITTALAGLDMGKVVDDNAPSLKEFSL